MKKENFDVEFPAPKVIYNKEVFDVISIDYDQKEFGLFDPAFNDNTHWVSCEKCELCES